MGVNRWRWAAGTPACIANAAADALGVAEISVPLTPERMLELLMTSRASAAVGATSVSAQRAVVLPLSRAVARVL